MSNIESQNDKTGQQKKEWSRLYGRPVSDEEHRQIQTNLSGFFETLKEWDDAERKFIEDERTRQDTNK